jgi:hypothetical protein
LTTLACYPALLPLPVAQKKRQSQSLHFIQLTWLAVAACQSSRKNDRRGQSAGKMEKIMGCIGFGNLFENDEKSVLKKRGKLFVT